MISTGRKRITEPLESITAIFGLLMIFGIAAGIAFTVFGPPDTGVFSSANVCVTEPGTMYSSSAWQFGPGMPVARPGNSLTVNGSLQVCANHAGISERVL